MCFQVTNEIKAIKSVFILTELDYFVICSYTCPVFSDSKWDKSYKVGTEKEKVAAADGWAEMPEASIAKNGVRHSIRCHWNQRKSGLWDQQVA